MGSLSCKNKREKLFHCRVEELVIVLLKILCKKKTQEKKFSLQKNLLTAQMRDVSTVNSR